MGVKIPESKLLRFVGGTAECNASQKNRDSRPAALKIHDGRHLQDSRMKNFQGQTAILTGAAAGIGQALARSLAREGCNLFLVDIDAAGLHRLCDELSVCPIRIWTATCDLTQSDDVQNMVSDALKLTGGIDLLINNAGVAYYGATDQMTQQQWDWLMSINLLTPIQITQLLLPSLLLREDPHIVNMCSISGLVAGGRFAAYHTSKYGLVGYTEALRAEYGRRGVGVTAICPGPVRTQLYDAAQSSRPGRKAPQPPAWLCATPEQVAEKTLTAIRRDSRQVLITPMAHLLFQLKRFAPGLIDFINRFSRRGRQKRLAAVAAARRKASVVAVAEVPSDAEQRAA
jgi:short-subunit dehydrogenase